MGDLSVVQAAEVLGVDPSRVRAMLRSGELLGRQIGHVWVVAEDPVYDLREHPRSGGRPMAARRAWAVLDLLEGGQAPWLEPVARSQVRAAIRRLAGAGPDKWRDALRRREDRYLLRAHPGAVLQLRARRDAWPAGPEMAEQADADLVAADPVPEFYVCSEEWPDVALRLHLSPVVSEPTVILRLPRDVWPFESGKGPGRAVVAASLLDGREWRAVRAGAEVLNKLAEGFVA